MTGEITNLSTTTYHTMEDEKADEECDNLNRVIPENYYWTVKVYLLDDD